MGRVFTSDLAERKKTPLTISLVGPSGCGKTYSALRLATGISRVVGGKIFGIDTEAGRMLHYADKFKFSHVPFTAPFGPSDYGDAIAHCIANGAKVIVIDSMSHEHSGPGGVLDLYDRGLKNGGKGDAKWSAWIEPKKQRAALVDYLTHSGCNFVLCFRGKEKIRPVKGAAPEKLGWQPIGGADYKYESMVQAILPAGCDGYPLWNPPEQASRDIVKVPSQYRDLLTRSRTQLSEEIGERMALWTNGSDVPTDDGIATPVGNLLSRLELCIDKEELEALRIEGRDVWKQKATTAQDKLKISSAISDAAARVASVSNTMSSQDPETNDPSEGAEP